MFAQSLGFAPGMYASAPCGSFLSSLAFGAIAIWEFLNKSGVLFWGPHTRDPAFFESISGSLIVGNSDLKSMVPKSMPGMVE